MSAEGDAVRKIRIVGAEMKASPTLHMTQVYRSRTEASWASTFNEHGIDFAYEPKLFLFDAVRPANWIHANSYLPDFHLRELGAWVEVKPYAPSAIEIEKAVLLAVCAGEPVFITQGGPLESDQMLQVAGFHNMEPVDALDGTGPIRFNVDRHCEAVLMDGFEPIVHGLVRALERSNRDYSRSNWRQPTDKRQAGATPQITRFIHADDQCGGCDCERPSCGRCRGAKVIQISSAASGALRSVPGPWTR